MSKCNEAVVPQRIYHHHHNRLIALFPGPLGWSVGRRELLDFTVQGYNRFKSEPQVDGQTSKSIGNNFNWGSHADLLTKFYFWTLKNSVTRRDWYVYVQKFQRSTEPGSEQFNMPLTQIHSEMCISRESVAPVLTTKVTSTICADVQRHTN